MGYQLDLVDQSCIIHSIMRFFILASALVAAAYADADPALVYGAYGYAGLPIAVGKSAPCVNAANVPVPCADGYVAGVHYLGKRDADADPALLYAGAYGAYPYAYAGLPHAYGKSAPCVNAANLPVPCAAGHLIAKRDADADPLLLGAYPYAAAPLATAAVAPLATAAVAPLATAAVVAPAATAVAA